MVSGHVAKLLIHYPHALALEYSQSLVVATHGACITFLVDPTPLPHRHGIGEQDQGSDVVMGSLANRLISSPQHLGRFHLSVSTHRPSYSSKIMF